MHESNLSAGISTVYYTLHHVEKRLLSNTGGILCPFAVYYLRYAVGSFFTMSRIPLADGKRAG
jgi:hypothetical protein